MQSKLRIFLDLDGVLADFDAGVLRVTGRAPHHFQKVNEMWRLLARAESFFAQLPWMQDGQLLWEATRAASPTILTGLPRGNWAAPQKRSWCARELGADVPVITCMSRDKAREAARVLRPGERPLLIDDREAQRDPWEAAGGVFILHRSAKESLQRLAQVYESE
ncbi:MAG: hypothetical protein VYD19_05145 [Myxococcota bacterium]|nr:hypothetical protein [Myxococcota bacterium]